MSPLNVDNVVALCVQAGVLVLVGAPLPRLLGVRSPRARLAYWRALLLACLLLPAVQPWVPQIAKPVGAGEGMTEQAVPADAAGLDESPSRPSSFALPRIGALDVVAAGVVARLAWFGVGLVMLARIRRRAARLEPPPGSVIDAIGLAGAAAEFRLDSTPSRPVTFGFLHPTVVVPNDFTEFAAEEQKAIACHELVHVRRRDWVRNVGDEVVRAVAWFHPAAWWLTRQIRLAREQVVDQEVVRHLGARKPYLDALLRLASTDRGSVFVPAPLFLGRSHLADRVTLLLKEVRMSRPRLAASFVAMAALLFLAGRAIVLAVPLHGDAVIIPPEAQPAQAGAAKPGQVTPKAAPAPTPKTVIASKVKDARPAFPPGSPETPVIVEGQIGASGAVTDAKVSSGPADLGAVALAAVKQWKFSAGQPQTLLVGFNPAASSGDLSEQPPVLVGGNVRPPAKIKDVKPVYPSDAQQSRVQGVVILETRIAADGAVSEARILRSVPMLNQAALDAVLGWKFTPAGFPVQMTVTVNFALDGGPSGASKGVPGGVRGGVAGGVAGGVEGGVAGGADDPAVPRWADMADGTKALRIGGGVKAPSKVLDVKPVYPKDAQDARVQGVVIIETMIGPDGKVKDTKILRSVPMLDEAALEAVRQWEFAPTLMNGQAVPVIMTITVNFTLE